jgi:hypothetical protein
VAPFGYHGVASGRLGHGDGPGTFHFANWATGWLEFYLARGFLRIDPAPLWALACGRPIGAMELRALVPRGHPCYSQVEMSPLSQVEMSPFAEAGGGWFGRGCFDDERVGAGAG